MKVSTVNPVNVLCVTDYFLPGFKAGGPIRTLQNIQHLLGPAVHFSYFTRNHDLGDSGSYVGIATDQWSSYAQGRVFYASRSKIGASVISRALSTCDADLIYLNSFFSLKYSIIFIVFNWVKSFGKPILLAPRGEFSSGALSLKSGRKRLFISLARALGLYRAVYWHASSERERNDILRIFPKASSHIFIAEDPIDIRTSGALRGSKKPAEMARLVFVSRISPMKNLDGLLEILQGVSCRVSLAIYGPIEDPMYWRRCEAMISALPPNIAATYHGELHPDQVSMAFASGDLFAFPTRGENFGHVIFEALAAGTPVLISDQTPWEPDATDAVTRLSLNEHEAWRAHIETIARSAASDQQQRRERALGFAKRYAASDQARLANLVMFQSIANPRVNSNV